MEPAPGFSSEEESILGYAASESYSEPSSGKQYGPVDDKALLRYPEGHGDVPSEWFVSLREFVRSFTYRYYLLLGEVTEEFETLGCGHYIHCQKFVDSREELYRSSRNCYDAPAFVLDVPRDLRNMVAPRNKRRRTKFRAFKDRACELVSDVERCRSIIYDFIPERELPSQIDDDELACPPIPTAMDVLDIDTTVWVAPQSDENWESLMERLSPALRRSVRFTGAVWSVDITTDISEPIPLFIAQAPVVVAPPPPPVWSPATTTVSLFKKPPDPLFDTPIDPTKALGEDVALKAFEAFPGSVAFLKFLDGTFIVVYPQGTDCSKLVDTIPTLFGRLPVDMATDKMVPCIDRDEISAQPMESGAPLVESATQGLPEGQVELYPGSRLTIRGPLFGQKPTASKKIPPNTTHFLPYICDAPEASAGVLVDTGNGEVALTTVSHFPLLHQRYTRKAIKALSLKLDRPKTAVGLKVYSDNHESPVADVHRIFDDEAHTKDYPTG
ncbi:hypothetical protein VTN77DRAFT_8083 [Rasamsonia byssochlamydoides]|uniref:uncharacterized protein n=1 Tax=Rasamsonia byssochlamydoides TaxID=89139 RepID=UPI0037424F1D